MKHLSTQVEEQKVNHQFSTGISFKTDILKRETVKGSQLYQTGPLSSRVRVLDAGKPRMSR